MPIQRNRQRDAKRSGSSSDSRRGRRKDRSSSTRSSDTRGSKAARSKQLKYSKWIESPEEHEDRKGQSLATQNHDVIRQWTQSRKAVPSVVGDTEGRDGAGVLRIDFPGFGGKRLKSVDWNEWFDTFDRRKLVFLYQEHKKDGSTSTFFKLAA